VISPNRPKGRGDAPTQDHRTQIVSAGFALRLATHGENRFHLAFASVLQSSAAGNAFVRVIDQQQRACFRKLTRPDMPESTIENPGSLQCDRWQGPGDAAPAAVAVDPDRRAHTRALASFTTWSVNLLRMNSAGYLIQNVVEFFVVHDLLQ
jgi:hypothetical protein